MSLRFLGLWCQCRMLPVAHPTTPQTRTCTKHTTIHIHAHSQRLKHIFNIDRFSTGIHPSRLPETLHKIISWIRRSWLIIHDSQLSMLRRSIAKFTLTTLMIKVPHIPLNRSHAKSLSHEHTVSHEAIMQHPNGSIQHTQTQQTAHNIPPHCARTACIF